MPDNSKRPPAIITAAALGLIAVLAGCAASPPPPRPMAFQRGPGVPATSVVDPERSQQIAVTAFSWKLAGPYASARGTFALANNGPSPVNDVMFKCMIYSGRYGFRIGSAIAHVKAPLPAGSTRTFADVRLSGDAPGAEDTVTCDDVISARQS